MDGEITFDDEIQFDDEAAILKEQMEKKSKLLKSSMDKAIAINREAIDKGDDTWYQRAQRADGSFDLNTPIEPNESILKQVGRGIAETIMPSTYETVVKGGQPGAKESTLDLALLGLNLLPGAGRAKGLLPAAKTVGGKATRYILPTLGIEGARGGAIEGLTSIAQDRPFDVKNAALTGALGISLDILPQVMQSKLKSSVENMGEELIKQIERKGITNTSQLKSFISSELDKLPKEAWKSGKLGDIIRTKTLNALDNAVKSGRKSKVLADQMRNEYPEVINEVFSAYRNINEPISKEFAKNIANMELSAGRNKQLLPLISDATNEAILIVAGEASKIPYEKNLAEIAKRGLPTSSIKSKIAGYASNVLPSLARYGSRPFIFQEE